MRTWMISVLLGFTAYLAPSYAQPASVEINGAPLPIRVLAQSPAETTTELQVICLFRSSPINTLHGSLTETNEKLHGLLDLLRKPELFRGEFAETVLVTPPAGSLGAKKLLIIGLGQFRGFLAAENATSGWDHPLRRGEPAWRRAILFCTNDSRRGRREVYHRRGGGAGHRGRSAGRGD